MDFFLLLIFDPEPEEVWYACDNNDKIFLILIFLTKNVISKDFVNSKGEIFVIVLSTGATERYILFLYPFLDYMRPKQEMTRKRKLRCGKQERNCWGDRLKRFQIEKLQSFRFVRGDKKRGTIYL
ncbi:hypothetical protein ACJX0J_001056 [Zea mays]